jgi:hypothetical protein
MRELLMILLLESSGYQCQDGIKHQQKYFSSFGGTQILVYILQGVKGSAKRNLKV